MISIAALEEGREDIEYVSLDKLKEITGREGDNV